MAVDQLVDVICRYMQLEERDDISKWVHLPAIHTHEGKHHLCLAVKTTFLSHARVLCVDFAVSDKTLMAQMGMIKKKQSIDGKDTRCYSIKKAKVGGRMVPRAVDSQSFLDPLPT